MITNIAHRMDCEVFLNNELMVNPSATMAKPNIVYISRIIKKLQYLKNSKPHIKPITVVTRALTRTIIKAVTNQVKKYTDGFKPIISIAFLNLSFFSVDNVFIIPRNIAICIQKKNKGPKDFTIRSLSSSELGLGWGQSFSFMLIDIWLVVVSKLKELRAKDKTVSSIFLATLSNWSPYISVPFLAILALYQIWYLMFLSAMLLFEFQKN
eukprot:NODE_30_length_32972_cov_0.541052.p13 type:complete len:210 gc:universal NODE_30_length_32972_cov_0.541052:1979-2608(+)